MFTVRVFVEDKKLPRLLWLLDGAIVGQPEITPVRGAAAKNGKIKSTQPVPGATLDVQVANRLLERGVGALDRGALKNVIVEVGGRSGSYGYVLKKLRKAKFLGPRRKDGAYPIIAK